MSILQSDAIFVSRGTENDIVGQKTISRDKKRYHGTYRFYVTVLSPRQWHKYLIISDIETALSCVSFTV